MGDKISVLIPEEKVEERIRELGKQIGEDYKKEGVEEILLIGILKGGAFFATELAKRLDLQVMVDFMAASSYGDSTESNGNVKITRDTDLSVEGRDILIVEDIIDTGRTLKALLEIIGQRGAKSIRLCTLLDKPDRRVSQVKVDYNGFKIPDVFVVGYGLDYAQRYRNLPYIGVVEPEK